MDSPTTIRAVFYVDDGMPGINDAGQKEASTWPDLAAAATRTATKWEQLLQELSKCFCFAVYWTWHNGRGKRVRPDDLEERVSVKDSGTQIQHKLEYVPPPEGRRTLGVRLSPSGTDKAEYEYWLEQGKSIAKCLQGTYITRTVAKLAYMSIITPKVEYPLAATCFNIKQTEKLMATYMPVSLRKMGYPRNFPRDVVFACREAGGLGLHHLFIEQGLAKLKSFMGHIRQNSRPGSLCLLKITLAWTQLLAGVSFPILVNTKLPLTWVEPCWIMNLRHFMGQHGLRIKMVHTPGTTSPARENDKSIMELFATKVKGADLWRLNSCRIYMRCEWMSDVVNGDGTQIRPSVLLCIRSQEFISCHKWPRGPRPPAAWRNI